MSEDEALKRLLRRVGREAATYERWAAAQYVRQSYAASVEYNGKASVLRMVQGFIREEMRKVKR